MISGAKYSTDDQTLKVRHDISIRDVDEISRILIDARASGAPLMVDVSDIHSLDIAIVQLLVAAQRQDAGTASAIGIIAPDGGVFHDVIRRAGLEHAFPHLRS